MTDDFDCTAYGRYGREANALCFLAGPGKRVCGSLDECREAMTAERLRLSGRIGEMAASGDPLGEYLAGEFTDPSQLLGGGGGTADGEGENE